MKVQENIDKIAWSLADKALFVFYGFIQLFQIRNLEPEEFGLYALLIGIHTWIFNISDSFALNNIIQFGMRKESRKKVNTLALLIHLLLAIGSSAVFYFLTDLWINIFKEENFYLVTNSLIVLTLLTIPRTYCLKFFYRDHNMKGLFFTDLGFFGSMSILTIYILLSFKTFRFEDMVNIYYVGMTISSLISLILTRKNLVFGIKGETKIRELLKFSFPMTLSTLGHSIPKNLDVVFLKLFFPSATIGVYGSAKTLFRLFDEANNAAYGLIYPAAVRQVEKNDKKALTDLMTKSVSFLLIIYAFSVLFLELGLSDFFIKLFFPVKYHFSISHFNILIISALFLPFVILSVIINAQGKPFVVFNFVFISAILFIVVTLLVGLSGSERLIPLGYLTYTMSLGILSYFYIKRHIGFKLVDLFRGFKDTKSFIKERLRRK